MVGRDDEVDEQVGRARGLLGAARHVVVLTGAGISTDSGLLDFRGPTGLWTSDPEAEARATIEQFLADGEVRAWTWQRHRRAAVWTRAPNAGHRALAALGDRGVLDLLITQNVDGLHESAGSDPARLLAVHGNLRWVRCIDHGHRFSMPDTIARVENGEDDPPCLACGSILRPDTVFFGEPLDDHLVERAMKAAEQCDLFLAVGTSLTVYPMNETVATAKLAGAHLIIINQQPTLYDRFADAVLRQPISDILPTIIPQTPLR